MQAQAQQTPLWPWRVATAVVMVGAGALAAAYALPVPLGQLLRPWYLSRGSGIVAFALLWLSVAIGLMQSCGLLKGLTPAGANIDLHEHASVLALYTTLFHALILIMDNYMGLGVADVLVPFATTYKTTLMALGILGLYTVVAAIVTTYLRSSMSARVWRVIHQTSLVGFLFTIVHAVMMGTDSARPGMVSLYLFCGVSVAVLTVYRIYLSLHNRAR
ncbi:MAG TPA: ferric reductase-like transmembrane domain-containing protein [Symbiobacteriaceae bacterium]|jgi:predicted ferric reductase|nr:ferric reductase-like transmembrane domain-containing protein [Symbiobacteriaceae bacterium]